ncbi:MAG TPA: phosphate/phosphite/phosphonate ABC transporter substrate-binding protein [Kofleriaceae bacterium]|nr:phosphate/phosphite/phosphonate ABC transporter substrate-binding protein [Kofleriaceae bacterium]
MSSDDKPTGGTLERTDVIARTRLLEGKYRLGRLIGEGGMGAVYQAEHEGLRAQVAVKLLSEHGSLDQKSVARFRREARAMGAIRHENVVSVMDTGTDEDGIPFLVMELLEGESLAAMLRRERSLSPGLSCWIASQILAGLGAAHAQGVVHRDLKPGNIFIARQSDGTHKVKILDFGISKLGGDSATLNVTAEGALVGTPNFMAPEQITGEAPLDARVDIYAVGVLLYRMVTGRLPYVGKTPDELYRKVLSGQPSPPRRRNPDIPPELEAVILKGMALDRNARYQDAASFRAALHEIAPTLPGELPTTTDSPRMSGQLPIAGGGPITGEPSIVATVAAGPGAMRAAGVVSGSHPVALPATQVPGAAAARRRRMWLAIAAGAVMLFGIATIAFIASRPAAKKVPDGPVLRYGVVHYSSPEKVTGQHRPIADYLQEKLDRPVELVMAADDKELIQKLFDGEVHLAALSAYAYIRAARRNTPGLVLLAKPVTSGGPSYQGLILTRADSGVRSLADLRGKSFCYVNPGSSSGFLYPRALLRQTGIDPDKDLGPSNFGQDHLNTLRLLDRGQCAAAAVYAKTLEDGDKAGIPSERFHQLAATERIPYDAYTVLARTPPEEVNAITTALLALEPGSPLARTILGRARGEIIGFTRAVDTDYDSARRVEQYVKATDIKATPLKP